MPKLPHLLIRLYCYSNLLKSLPDLPLSLRLLGCGLNHLDTLPRLPDSLVTLSCDSAYLKSLPKLPDVLTELMCSNNSELKCLPKLPVLNVFFFVNTGITCIPNYFPTNGGFQSAPSMHSVPLCNSSSNCFYQLGLYDEKPKIDFDIFPNPAKDILHFNTNISSAKSLVFYEASGRIIREQSFVDSIDISLFASGVYFVELISEEGTVRRRFVR